MSFPTRLWSFRSIFCKLKGEVDPIVIVANGHPLESSVIQMLGPRWPIACADGGANRLASYRKKMKMEGQTSLWPELVVGDLDSVRPATLRMLASSRTQVLLREDQDENDLSKCMKECSLRWPSSQFILLSALGGSLQHTLANFSYISRWASHSPVCWSAKHSAVFFEPLVQHVLEDCPVRHSVGIFPMGRGCDRVTTTGLEWNLHNDALCFGELVSSSNRIAESSLTISSSHPIMMIIESS